MLSKLARASASTSRSVFTQQNASFATKAAVLGAAGGIGQPLSMLLKMDKNVSKLSLFDVAPITPGVAADLSHINTPCSTAVTEGVAGMENIGKALEGANIVVVPAGVPRKPGMTRDDLFNINGGINVGLAEACARYCPEAMFLIISNPVNSTVPIWAEVLKKAGVYNPKHLFGVTTLDVTRANTFVSENQGFDVNSTKVDVIGGHAGTTILPLLSQVPNAKFSDEDLEKLTHRIQFGGDEVVEAKAGGGSATLSMAYAGAEFASYVARGLNGETGLKVCTMVENDLTKAPFFSTSVTLGTDGVSEIHGFGKLSDFEQKVFDGMIGDLVAQAEKGAKFVTEK